MLLISASAGSNPGSRPCMRARRALADLCAEAGERDETILNLQALFELNPRDNQGNRYPLLGLLLTRGAEEDRARARALIARYEPEGDS
jgi:hypothetical protein